MAATNDLKNGGNFLRSRLKHAFHSSNDIISGISNNISSRISMFSNASSSSLNCDLPTPNNVDNEDAESEPALPLHMLPDTIEPMLSPQLQKRSQTTVKEKIKETFKLENLRPALEDFMGSDESTEPSTLPTNTPESPKSGFRFKISSAINQSLPKKLEDYKALAIRTLSGEGGENSGADRKLSPCAIKVVCVDSIDGCEDNLPSFCKENNAKEYQEIDNASTSLLASRSLSSLQSVQVNGPNTSNNKKHKSGEVSSDSPSDNGVGHSTSLDSSDSDPHRKLWVRSGSQTSLQSWASSLSYDSHSEEINEIREFMKSFVEDIFKNTLSITVDRKSEYGKLAQSEQGRLWFARCINAKRCCKCVTEATFFSLIQHFAVMLFECAEADDFSPAKSLMNMCFTYYHEVCSSVDTQTTRKAYMFTYLRQQPIWRSLRFWNAAFFDALQCERFMRPVATREQVKVNRSQALVDELRYQENITFGQLGTFTCNMHAFGLPKEMVTEFLRKQVTIGSLREDQVSLLQDNVQRMFSETREWQ